MHASASPLPSAVGFSYTDNPAGLIHNDSSTAADNLAAVLKCEESQWSNCAARGRSLETPCCPFRFPRAVFEGFPELRANPFWVAGESYGEGIPSCCLRSRASDASGVFACSGDLRADPLVRDLREQPGGCEPEGQHRRRLCRQRLPRQRRRDVLQRPALVSDPPTPRACARRARGDTPPPPSPARPSSCASQERL